MNRMNEWMNKIALGSLLTDVASGTFLHVPFFSSLFLPRMDLELTFLYRSHVLVNSNFLNGATIPMNQYCSITPNSTSWQSSTISTQNHSLLQTCVYEIVSSVYEKFIICMYKYTEVKELCLCRWVCSYWKQYDLTLRGVDALTWTL